VHRNRFPYPSNGLKMLLQRTHCPFLLVAFVVIASALLSPAQAQTFKLVWDFNQNYGAGTEPYAGVIRDAAGDLFGTASAGGRARCGVVYEINRLGNEPHYAFQTRPDGCTPMGSLARDNAGNFYGTTTAGGVYGWGAIFKIDRSGHETVLYSFPSDLGFAYNVILDSQGNLYGTLSGTGSNGQVYKLDAGGHYSVIHTFSSGHPGGYLVPSGGSILYGTTCGVGAGTIFSLDVVSGQYTTLYSFDGEDGDSPAGRLLLDSQGNLYGATNLGGMFNSGTVFKLDSARHLTVLYNFTGGADGLHPGGGVVKDAAGNLFGTTEEGGSQLCLNGGCGVVYKVDPAGNQTVLHMFEGSDGEEPIGELLMDPSGNLFGVTVFGGVAGPGVLYELTP